MTEFTNEAATEEWRPVPDSNDWYDVSSLGRVRSWHRLGRYPGPRQRATQPKLLKLFRRPDGHMQVFINIGGGGRPRKVHRLVALAFIGEEPPGMEVCHNDGDPANNHLSNLRYGTRAENIADRYKHGWKNAGEHHGANKLTEAQALEVKRLAGEGQLLQRDIGERFGISQTAVSKIVTGRMWRHLQAA